MVRVINGKTMGGKSVSFVYPLSGTVSQGTVLPHALVHNVMKGTLVAP